MDDDVFWSCASYCARPTTAGRDSRAGKAMKVESLSPRQAEVGAFDHALLTTMAAPD